MKGCIWRSRSRREGRLPIRMCGVEMGPDGRKWIAEIAEQLGKDLPHRLRLLRQLGEVVAVVDRPLPEACPRVPNERAVPADDRDSGGADGRGEYDAGPATDKG